jgi:ubiquinol-cytochrome c reductase cytochrome b subunit
MSKFSTWLEDRTGLVKPVRSFLRYPVPKYVHKNLLYTLGGLTLITFLLQIITGVLLMFYYDPSPEGAYNSVDYVTYQVPSGWLVRGVHYYGSSAMVILAALHMLRTYFMSTYKKPRELNWLSGVFLLLLVFSFGFTGYLLPWDQKGYWATKVGTEIAASVPFIGTWIMQLMRGGAELGQATLTRFYASHVMLLPALTILFMLAHIMQLRRHGNAPPITERAKKNAGKFVPFFPHWVITDTLFGLALLALLVYLSWTKGAPLEFPADPTSSDYVPRPEWYFLFLFQALKYFPGPLEPIASVFIPLFIFAAMIALPFLDRSEERRPWKKPITSGIAIVLTGIIVLLTVLAW